MDKYLATNSEKMDRCLKKKLQIEDSTNNAIINELEYSVHSAVLSYAFSLNTEILTN